MKPDYMGKSCDEIVKSWYVLHFIHAPGKPSPRHHIDDFNKNGHDLELFAPIIRPAEIINGKVIFKEKLLTYYYVFVRGVLEELKELCARTDNNLSMMLNRGGAQRYATIKDSDMERFQIIAKAHINSIPFFSIEDIDLEEGDIVEVIDGIFAGLVGVFMPKSRSSKGNIVIAASAKKGAIVWNIDAKYVRILEFAKDTRRQYDIIDSFVPRLYPIMRKYYLDLDLNDKEKSQLVVFNSRMCMVKLSNPKLEAKLLAILMCVQQILGEEALLHQSKLRFEHRRSAITNPWISALVALLDAVSKKDISCAQEEYDKIKEISNNVTSSQSNLLKEYEFYLSDICRG